MKNKKVEITKDREVRTYAELWHTSYCLLKKAEEHPKGSFHQYMASLVFTAFALEAYLNHVGPKVFNCWLDLERLGPKEKLNIICEIFKINPDHSRRPWQVLKELYGFRNDIAHGKSVNISEKDVIDLKDHKDEGLPSFIQTRWEKYSNKKNAERAREDVREIVNIIHSKSGITDEHPFITGVQLSGETIIEQ